MAESHITALLAELIQRSVAGTLHWTRSTEDQVLSGGAETRIVLTRRDGRFASLAMLTGAQPIGEVRLTIHTVVNGKVTDASVTVDSARLPDHADRLQTLWRYAQEAADAPVLSVVAFLRSIGAGEVADRIEPAGARQIVGPAQ